MREGEETGMGDAPIFICVLTASTSCFAMPCPCRSGRDGDRSEKADAAPFRHEISANQFPVAFGGKARDMLGAEPAIDVIAVGAEGRRVGCSETRTECRRECVGPPADRDPSMVG